MKTLDEVIKANECCNDDNRCEDCPYNGIGACALERQTDSLQYLREYREQRDQIDALPEYYDLVNFWAESQANPPLTWDELKMMEGKPVWVEYNLHIGNKDFRDNSKRWCIVREFKPWHDTEIIITENGFVLSKNEQIKCWQAYRKERS